MKLHNEILLDELYSYIESYQKETGKSPSYREIMKRHPKMLSSTAKVKSYLDVLERRGRIRKTYAGSIAVEERFLRTATATPLIGHVACGQPIEAIESIEGVYSLPSEIFGNGNLIMLKAEGQSMINVGIDTGDLIVIRSQQTAEYGQMVLALIEDQATVKTYFPQTNGNVVLHPENDEMEDILVKDCKIQGIVVGCIKTYASRKFLMNKV